MKISITDNLNTFRKLQELLSFNLVSSKHFMDTTCEGVGVRIYNRDIEKTIIYIHGGGFISGSLNTHNNLCYYIAKELNRRVIAIDYRLAPEYKFPTSIEDCLKVTNSICKNCSDVWIMGDSAGANLAFAVVMEGKRQFKVNKIIMIYPATQTDYTIRTKYKSVLANSGKSMLTKEGLRDYMRTYLRNEKDYKDKRVNILRYKWLFGLPPVVVFTGGLDPLHDEGVAFVCKLKRFFVKVKHYDFKGATHGFMTSLLGMKYLKKTIDIIKEDDENE